MGTEAGASAEKYPGFVKQTPPCVCRQKSRLTAAPGALSLLFPCRGICGSFGRQHWHWLCSLLAASSHLLLQDKQLSNPTTTELLRPVPNGLHAARGIWQHLYTHGRARCVSFPPSTTQTALLREKIKEKKKQEPQPHPGRMYKPTGLRVSFTGNFITVL